MKKILSVSNSFGVDATRYLYGICRAAGEPVKVVTLYIGGCSLSSHYRNMLSEEKAYAYYVNGMDSGLTVSLKEALLSDRWDVISTQQCSPDSGDEDSYFPYLSALAEYFRKCAPKAELHLQATWSFAEGCPRFAKTGFSTREEMIPAVEACYNAAAEAISADGVIPGLAAMNRLYDAVGPAAYRDGFHASYGLGRYLLACVWFRYFFRRPVTGNSFRDFDEAVSEEQIRLAQKIAEETVVLECRGDGGIRMKLIDLHAHSSGISSCCKVTGEQAVDSAKAAGLDGFVLTNHYGQSYVGGTRFPTYEDLACAYLEEYRRIRKYGESVGFRVLFGVEVTAGWNSGVHLLAYGVPERFVTDHPRMCEYSAEELYRTVHEYGGILIQAHPYRHENRLQELSLLDGVEISCHAFLKYGGSFAAEMKELAQAHGKLLTCGGDYHGDVPYRPECGAFLPDSVADEKSLKEYLCSASSLTLRVHEPGGAVFDLEFNRKENA